MYVDSELIAKARSADLYNFLMTRHTGEFRVEGASLRMLSYKSISIKRGYYGYSDFSNGETGNGIDFLMKYLGYSFQEAVISLAGSITPKTMDSDCILTKKTASIPDPAPLPHSRMFAFLISRGIPGNIVSVFARKGLIYQSANNNNIVFINKERDYCELRGTYTYAERPFHGCVKTHPNRFWYFTGSDSKPRIAYVTEAAIDAISLWLIQRLDGTDTSSSVYISIGGASNHSTIDRIKHGIRTILAVDNDVAGDSCRKHHPELEYIIPLHKDWNDDLQYKTGKINNKTR